MNEEGTVCMCASLVFNSHLTLIFHVGSSTSRFLSALKICVFVSL